MSFVGFTVPPLPTVGFTVPQSPTGSLATGIKRPGSSLSHDAPTYKRTTDQQLELTTPVNQIEDSERHIGELYRAFNDKISALNHITLNNSLAHRSIYANKDSVGSYTEIIELIQKINLISDMPVKKYELLNALYNRAQIILNICMHEKSCHRSEPRFTITGVENTAEGFLSEQYQILKTHYPSVIDPIAKKNWQTVMGQIAALFPHHKYRSSERNAYICGTCAATDHFLKSAIMPGHESNASAAYNAGRLAQSYILASSIHGDEDCLSTIKTEGPDSTDVKKQIQSSNFPQESTHEQLAKLVGLLVQENIHYPIEAQPIEKKLQMIFRCNAGINIAKELQDPRNNRLQNQLTLIYARGVLSRYIELTNQITTVKNLNKAKEIHTLTETYRSLYQHFASPDSPENERFRQELMSSIARYLPPEYFAKPNAEVQNLCIPCDSISNQLVSLSNPRKRKAIDSILGAQDLAISYRNLRHEYRGCVSPFVQTEIESLPSSPMSQIMPINPSDAQKKYTAPS